MLAAEAPCVLDVRPLALFLRGHAANAYSIPWSEMKQRGFELPARGRRLAVYTADDDAAVAAAVEWFATRSERCRWTTASVARWKDGNGDAGPSRRGQFLFGASPLLAQTLALGDAFLPEDGGRKLRALDVGSGSGRDAAVLAAGGRFETVAALDRDKKALARWGALLERHALDGVGVAVHANLAREGDLQRALAGAGLPGRGGWDLVNVCRHLHRPTLGELACLLAPGGVLLYHSFLEGCAHPTGEDKLLGRGELRRVFGAAGGGAGLQVDRDEELPIEEDGRLCSFFRARAPPDYSESEGHLRKVVPAPATEELPQEQLAALALSTDDPDPVAMVFGNRDLLELILAPLDGWGLRAAEGVGKGWRDVAREAPLRMEFAVHGAWSGWNAPGKERQLRAVCAVGGLRVVLDPEADIALCGVWEAGEQLGSGLDGYNSSGGALLLEDGTTLRGGTLRGHGVVVLGSVRIEDVNIFDSSFCGILVKSVVKSAAVAIQGGRIAGSERSGVHVEGGGSSATLTGVVVEHSECYGLCVVDGGEATVDGGRISHNGFVGVHVDGAGSRVCLTGDVVGNCHRLVGGGRVYADCEAAAGGTIDHI